MGRTIIILNSSTLRLSWSTASNPPLLHWSRAHLVHEISTTTIYLLSLRWAWGTISKSLGQLVSQKNLSLFKLDWLPSRCLWGLGFCECRQLSAGRKWVHLGRNSSAYFVLVKNYTNLLFKLTCGNST